MTNVSGSVSQKSKTLFPSTSGVVKQPVSAFDPTRESVVAVNKKRKRKAVRIKSVALAVMAITSFTYTIPKGKHYNKALREA